MSFHQDWASSTDARSKGHDHLASAIDLKGCSAKTLAELKCSVSMNTDTLSKPNIELSLHYSTDK